MRRVGWSIWPRVAWYERLPRSYLVVLKVHGPSGCDGTGVGSLRLAVARTVREASRMCRTHVSDIDVIAGVRTQ